MDNEKTQELVLKLLDIVTLLLQSQIGNTSPQEASKNSTDIDQSKLDLFQVMIDQINMKSDISEMERKLKTLESKMEQQNEELQKVIQFNRKES
ncbi:hypothetical protein [Ureibacillus acetophenoni]|uniref:Uncharacterized protein n=1 Tax=Ureibacillus acetophenoni TaxID=614649 RepID=A0A285TYT4_9BACL|nr:hypothetical protein [Ureibacillus acetophenoni]SOC34860.1 hypothetical protein SAMN05877842_101133 [Ureibacillus acetophenoni]